MLDPSRVRTDDPASDNRWFAHYALTQGRQPRPAWLLLDICERFRRAWTSTAGAEKRTGTGYHESQHSAPAVGACPTAPDQPPFSGQQRTRPAAGPYIVAIEPYPYPPDCGDCALQCPRCPAGEVRI